MSKITDDDARKICLVGTGSTTCRYLVMGADGWECAKLTWMKAHIDRRVSEGTFRALGDNCGGK